MSKVGFNTGVVRLFFACSVVMLLQIGEVYALGELTVTPTRIVFGESERSAKVTLINTGNEAVTYRISWSRKRMTESGGYEDVSEVLPGEKFSDEMIRFSPRQVVLPPGKPQVVRLLLRKPSQLENGEYRSYMKFTAIPQSETEAIEQQVDAGSKGITIRLTPIMAISIPVIVRQGELSAQVDLQSPELQLAPEGRAPYKLEMTMERSGDRSVYGDFLVYFDDEQGKRHVVGQANGFAAYPPLLSRRVELPLYPPQGKKLENGKLHMIYRQQPDEGGETLAEVELSLP